MNRKTLRNKKLIISFMLSVYIKILTVSYTLRQITSDAKCRKLPLKPPVQIEIKSIQIEIK